MVAPLSTLRILVADDSAIWREYVRSLLHHEHAYQVVEASNGPQAVQRAAEVQPQIVVLDIGMPVLNGIEAAKLIRKLSPQSRIVFFTQNDDAEIKSVALATGAVAYVVKDDAASELLPSLRDCVPA